MVPPLHHFALTTIIIIVFSFSISINPCEETPPSSSPPPPCPPFTSPLSYPFSSSPGCGHPHFQIRCSTPLSTISINNNTFSILTHDPNTTSLTLSPPTHSLPTHSINLSTSPFHFLDRSCSRLSAIKSCSIDTRASSSSVCKWECELFKDPIKLLHGCKWRYRSESEVGCTTDMSASLRNFLKMGFGVEWNEEDSYFSQCKDCREENGVCGFNTSQPHNQFHCYHPHPHPHSQQLAPWIRRDSPNRIVLLSTLFICACFLALVGVITLIFRYRRVNPVKNEEDPTMLFLNRHRSSTLLPPVFNYEELDSATNHFDNRRKIGDGGFGAVYLGQLFDNRIVAVKKLHKPPQSITKNKSIQAFQNEILILSLIQHPNLVKLHGYCSDSRGLLLVYDYVPNGTLADHLHGSYKKGALSWQVRVEIALQTAMAIEYLHFEVKPAIVHRDITSSNIFVEKDMRIKVGDFGLSRLLICSESSSSSSSGSGFICTGPQGTPGYLDPDYHRSFRLTEKSDVYSFGVLLFELISGMKAVDLARDKREVALADLVVSKIHVGSLHQVVDPVLIVEGEAMGTVDSMAELAFRCVAGDKDDRPDAREVVAELKRIKNRTRGHRGFNLSGDVCKV